MDFRTSDTVNNYVQLWMLEMGKRQLFLHLGSSCWGSVQTVLVRREAAQCRPYTKCPSRHCRLNAIHWRMSFRQVACLQKMLNPVTKCECVGLVVTVNRSCMPTSVKHVQSDSPGDSIVADNVSESLGDVVGSWLGHGFTSSRTRQNANHYSKVELIVRSAVLCTAGKFS